MSRTLALYTGVFQRRFFSDNPTQCSTEAPVKRGRGRPRKPQTEPKEPQTESKEPHVKPEKPQIDVAPEKKRRTRSLVAKPRPSRRPGLTEEELKVSKLILPPIDKWRQYFAIMEGQRLRFFLRNPDTAQTLAEAFVPEGSKDLIIIEAAAGMHS